MKTSNLFRLLFHGKNFLRVTGLLILLSIPVSGQNYDAPFSVLSTDENSTTIEFNMPELQFDKVTIDGKDWNLLTADNMISTMVKGLPMLPEARRSIHVGDLAAYSVRIIRSEVSEIDLDLGIAPSKGHLTRNIDPASIPFVFDKVYNEDKWYPEINASIGETYIVRDLRGQNFIINPVQYNPLRKKLRIYNKILFEIYADNAKTPVNQYVRSKPLEKVSAEFSGIYNTLFLNYGKGFAEYTPIPEPGRLLIIYHSSYASTVQPFYEWKLSKGMPTIKAEYPTETGTGSAAIKTYIQNLYNSAAGLTYIILIGESNQIPTLYGQSEGAASDPSYVKLVGSDAYPDAYISRISVANATNLEYVLHKIQRYETMPFGGSSAAWYLKGTGVASSEGSPPDWQRANLLRDLLYDNMFFTEVDEIYDPGATAAMVSAALNEGRSIINYIGHGSGTSWSTTGFSVSNVNSLNNGWMNPFIIDVACLNGDFEMSECMEEAWLRAGSMTSPKGAIAVYGSSTNASWVPPCDMQNHGMMLLTTRERNTVGGVSFNGVMYAMDLWGGSTGEGLKLMEQYNIFGDCSTLMTFGSEPDSIAPEPVTDLQTSNYLSNGMTLNWTSPMDSSVSGVVSYDIRYSQSPIANDNDFANAASVIFPGSPDSAGMSKSYELTELQPATQYYFALKAIDIWGNVSEMSNVVQASTLAQPVISVSPDAVTQILPQNVIVTDTVTISNISVDPSSLDYTVELANNTFPGLLKARLIPAKQSERASGERKKGGLESERGSSLKGAGGPDLFGYEWIDSNDPEGPDYLWEDISTTGTLVSNWIPTGTFSALDEGYAGPINTGINFKYYGEVKGDIYFSSNGFVTFEMPSGNTFSNVAIPGSSVPNDFISPFWDDLDGKTTGKVYYKTDGNKFIVQYDKWMRYSGSGEYTYQIVLYSSGKIVFYYKLMTGAVDGGTVGIENNAGNDGLQISYNSAYIQNEMAVKISAEPDWLLANNTGGRLYNGNSADLVLEFNTTDLTDGDYSMDVKISSTDPAAPQVIVPVSMTIGEAVPFWTCILQVQDAGGAKSVGDLMFGQAAAATDGIDTQLGEFELPPVPPAGVFDARFLLSNNAGTIKDIRSSNLEEITWHVNFQAGSAGYPFSISWNPAYLPVGSFHITDPFGGILVDVDMRENSTLQITNTAINSLVIKYRKMSEMTFNTVQGWNLVSLPMHPESMMAGDVFPEATSPVYGFNGNYNIMDSLHMGEGYWVKFAQPLAHTMMGQYVSQPVEVSTGWNLIGPFDQSVTVSGITSVPAGIISSVFFGFNESYYIAENLEATKGYWVKVSQDGVLNLNANAKTIARTNENQKSESIEINIRDAAGKSFNVYFVSGSKNGYEMPPVPPAGVFDVRFNDGYYAKEAGDKSAILQIRDAVYPLTIRVTGGDVSVAEAVSGRLLSQNLSDGSPLTISDPAVTGLLVEAISVPFSYQLFGNYPNPFNPSTKIKFALPVSAVVTLRVFNAIGEEVAVLGNREYSQGIHEEVFGAESVSGSLTSGVYFYTIDARGSDGTTFRSVNKMMLLK